MVLELFIQDPSNKQTWILITCNTVTNWQRWRYFDYFGFFESRSAHDHSFGQYATHSKWKHIVRHQVSRVYFSCTIENMESKNNDTYFKARTFAVLSCNRRWQHGPTKERLDKVTATCQYSLVSNCERKWGWNSPERW